MGLRSVPGKLLGNISLLPLTSFKIYDKAVCCTCSKALSKLLQGKGWVEAKGIKEAGMAE